MISGKFNTVVDCAWGSSGKGAVSARLADIYNIENLSSANYPNAGHTVRIAGKVFVFKSLPSGAALTAIGKRPELWLGCNSGFKQDVLDKELNETNYRDSDYIHIHGRAMIVEPRHIEAEEPGGHQSTLAISSTMSGSGAALTDKAMRGSDVVIASKVRKEALSSWKFWKDCQLRLDAGQTFLHEVSQGFALSLNWGTHYPYCLHGDSRVLTENGPMKIRDIVDRQIQCNVWCVSDEGKFEIKHIIGWHKNALGDRHWLQVITPTSRYNKDGALYGPSFTNDHEVLTNNGYKRLDELTPGDGRVIPGDRIANGEMQYDDIGYQVFLGSMLGDGCVCRPRGCSTRAELSISHGPKQHNYLRYKASILSITQHGGCRPIITSESSFKAGQEHLRYESAPSYYLYELSTSFGCCGKKRDTINATAIIDQINELGLAVWYMDDGQLKNSTNGQEVWLHTQGFTLETHQQIITCLAKKFDIISSINFNGKGMPYLRISRGSHEKWFKLISKHIHQDLRYKVPPAYMDTFEPSTAAVGVFATEPVMAVQQPSINRRKSQTSYCIEVAEHHNFLVSHSKGFLVSKNCTSRDCTPHQAYSDFGILSHQIGDVYLNVRSFPIRVGNNYDQSGNMIGYSGDAMPDCKETSWEEIATNANMPPDIAVALAESERTTVTKKIRRVFTQSWELLKFASEFCGATKLVLNFPQYIDWSIHKKRGSWSHLIKNFDIHPSIRAYVDKMEDVTNLPVVMIGTGADHEDYIIKS